MAQSELNVSNLALRLIGSRVVLASMADVTTEGLACAALVDDAKKALIRMHPWNFATRRAILPRQSQYASCAFAPFAAGTIVTCATHGLANGDSVQFVDGDGGAIDGLTSGPYEVSSVAATTFVIADAPFADITYTSGDAFFVRYDNDWDTFRYVMPASLLRVIRVNDDTAAPEWSLEDNKIVTADGPNLMLKYLHDVTDYPAMDALFYQALGYLLGYNLCDHITASDGKKSELHSYLYGGGGRRGLLTVARYTDGTENPPAEHQANDWLYARFGGTGRGFVRNPGT